MNPFSCQSTMCRVQSPQFLSLFPVIALKWQGLSGWWCWGVVLHHTVPFLLSNWPSGTILIVLCAVDLLPGKSACFRKPYFPPSVGGVFSYFQCKNSCWLIAWHPDGSCVLPPSLSAATSLLRFSFTLHSSTMGQPKEPRGNSPWKSGCGFFL